MNIQIRIEAAGVAITIADGRVSIIEGAKGAHGASNGALNGTGHTAREPLDGSLPEAGARRRTGRLRKTSANGSANGAQRGGHRAVIARQRRPPWTEEQHQQLRTMWGIHSLADIAKTLGRPVLGVEGKALRLGLKASRTSRAAPRPPAAVEAAEDPDPAPANDAAADVSAGTIADAAVTAEGCGNATVAPDPAGDRAVGIAETTRESFAIWRPEAKAVALIEAAAPGGPPGPRSDHPATDPSPTSTSPSSPPPDSPQADAEAAARPNQDTEAEVETPQPDENATVEVDAARPDDAAPALRAPAGLHEIPGMTAAMVAALGEHGITGVEDLAGCATDDLAGWTDIEDGRCVRTPGFLETCGVTRGQCEALIMQARLKASWVTEERESTVCRVSTPKTAVRRDLEVPEERTLDYWLVEIQTGIEKRRLKPTLGAGVDLVSE